LVTAAQGALAALNLPMQGVAFNIADDFTGDVVHAKDICVRYKLRKNSIYL
jgi:hypothetical protein